MTPATSPRVTLQDVSRRYGAQLALDRVSVTIEPGEFVAVIGRSGAGKTTMIRCLSRSVVATGGAVCFDGRDVGGLRGASLRAHRADVGVIYQHFNLVKRLRVLDNVLVGRLPHLRGWQRWASLARRFDAADREIAFRCLDHVGLLGRAWQRTDTLSGGEQQRVAIAKLLAQAPRLVLGDEPVASLDLANGTAIMETLRRIASDTGLTVIATLHHVEYARRYADRVLGLRAGRLVFDGPARDLDDAALAHVFGSLPPEEHGDATAAPAAPLAVAGWAAG